MSTNYDTLRDVLEYVIDSEYNHYLETVDTYGLDSMQAKYHIYAKAMQVRHDFEYDQMPDPHDPTNIEVTRHG
jgi:hypothetical protein